MRFSEIFADPMFPIGATLALLLALAYVRLPV